MIPTFIKVDIKKYKNKKLNMSISLENIIF